MTRNALVLLSLAWLSGCATTHDVVAVADRASGRVSLSYVVERPDAAPLGDVQANRVATRHCEQLGYAYTERNVAVRQACSAGRDGDCTQWQVERTYQCAGNAVAEPQLLPVAVVPPGHG